MDNLVYVVAFFMYSAQFSALLLTNYNFLTAKRVRDRVYTLFGYILHINGA